MAGDNCEPAIVWGGKRSDLATAVRKNFKVVSLVGDVRGSSCVRVLVARWSCIKKATGGKSAGFTIQSRTLEGRSS